MYTEPLLGWILGGLGQVGWGTLSLCVDVVGSNFVGVCGRVCGVARV